ncbi:MAG: capsule biosynthesis protein CapG [Treponema sp.]|nr:capsule biosynthesis protein CapG [Treponema sp.]
MKIDFVVPWVDGNDPAWIEDFNKYSSSDRTIDNRTCNYRDFDLLKYWFRGVEKFASWVNKVYFVTNGQKPSWLNLNNEKLVFVMHSDYMPKNCLPTFSSEAIEIALNKLPGLAEHFVYFNDDFYLTDYIQPSFFFRKNIPVDELILSPLVGSLNSLIGHSQLVNCAIINEHFSKFKFVKNNLIKYFNVKYGLNNFRNLLMLPFPYISAFLNQHFAQPFLKSVLDEVWSECSEYCSATQRNRFRSACDVNQWLFRYWQLMSGKFFPINLEKQRKYFVLGEKFDDMCDMIKRQRYKEIVINDSGYNMTDLEQRNLRNAFDFILAEKSSFEI